MKWILSFIVLSSLAHAQFERSSEKTCTGIDLRSERMGEVRDQKKVSWCYAFTAADMLGYFYDLPERASAADIAINYNDTDLAIIMRNLRERFRLGESETFMMPHQTGFNKIALQRVMKHGYCPERVFPSESWTKFTKTEEGWVESQNDLKPAMIEIYELLKDKKLTVKSLPFYYHFKNVESPEEFMAIIKNSSTKNFYSKLRSEVCKHDRIKVSKSKPVSMFMKGAAIFSTINQALTQKRMVGIDYDSRILLDRNSRGVRIDELHTSSIVARRWNKKLKECEYLVRDSHGNQCSPERYDQSYECLGGQIWLGESLMYASLVSAVFIKSE